MSADHSDSFWLWRCFQDYVVNPILAMHTCLGLLLPFPLENAEGVLWRHKPFSGGGATTTGRLPPNVLVDGSTSASSSCTAAISIPGGSDVGGAVVLPSECLVAPRHFATLTNGAQSLEDAVGWAFERGVPLVLVLHSELSRESCTFMEQLGRAVNACAGLSQVSKGSSGVTTTSRGVDGLQHRSGSTTVDGPKSLAPAATGPTTNGSGTVTCPLNSVLGRVQWYVLSMFSEECSYLSAAAACAAPAILTFVPLGGPSGMTQLGSLEGPMTTTDVAKFIKQCEEKWHAYPRTTDL